MKIRGIWNARKITLKSYGIETAADVDYTRILAISGFGPTTAQSLVDWQQNVKSGFRFDPNLAVDPADIAAIKANIAARRADLEARARHSLSKLERAASDAAAIRANPGSQAADAWAAWSNAQRFEKELRPSTPEIAKLATVGAVGTISLFSYSHLIVSIPAFINERQTQQEVATSTQPPEAEPRSSASGSVAAQPGLTSPLPAPSSATDQPAGPARPSEAAPPSPVLPSTEGTDGAKPPPRVSSGIAGVAPKETTLAPGAVPGPLHYLLNRPGAIWLQDRLRELGYYHGSSDGVWGFNSKAALRAFKTQNGLPADDKWDAATESQLLGLAQAGGNQTFEGSWAEHVGDCGIEGNNAPVKISQKGAQAKSGNCEFQNVRREGKGWEVRGFCSSAASKSWEADIHLSLIGSALTWSSERGTVTYFRCR